MRKTSKRVSEVGRSQRVRIIHTLKKTQGLSVNQLSGQLGLSYMGVKQHCEELERQGLVDTWRRPKAVGRPELVYRLTSKAQSFFPTSSNGATIEVLNAAKRLYGPAAPEKLLYSLFAAKAANYLKQVRGAEIRDRADALAKARDEEGYLSELMTDPRLVIVEYHSPILDLLEIFPLVRRLEKEMVEKVLGVPVHREEKTASGLYECRFVIAT
jgi:predicted ArsR family transcriptional regulator